MIIEYTKTPEALRLESLHENLSFTPVRAYPTDAGADLSACIEDRIEVLAGEVVKIGTGVCISLASVPNGMSEDGSLALAGLNMPRSSIKGLLLTNSVGLIDFTYEGELFVKLYNYTDEPIFITRGQKLVQYVVVPVLLVDFQQKAAFSTLYNERGIKGDGSSGK